jgi:hypothetical protein
MVIFHGYVSHNQMVFLFLSICGIHVGSLVNMKLQLSNMIQALFFSESMFPPAAIGGEGLSEVL